MTSCAVLVRIAAFVTTLLGLVSCGFNNGLPGDLKEHLQERGIPIVELASVAPLSKRWGYVVVSSNPSLLNHLRASFQLQSVLKHSERCMESLAVNPVEVWAIFGRPTSLTLRNGGQFEYLCVVVSKDAKMYLVTEYSYG